jgi:hypothetical protein
MNRPPPRLPPCPRDRKLDPAQRALLMSPFIFPEPIFLNFIVTNVLPYLRGKCDASLTPSCLPANFSCKRKTPVTPFPATHRKNAPVIPLLATRLVLRILRLLYFLTSLLRHLVISLASRRSASCSSSASFRYNTCLPILSHPSCRLFHSTEGE